MAFKLGYLGWAGNKNIHFTISPQHQYHCCSRSSSLFSFSYTYNDPGVVASAGWWLVWWPYPKVEPGAFSGQRQGWKTSKRTLWQCTACVCSGSALLGDVLGVSRSMERELLCVLLIYPRIFLCEFIVYRHIVGILCLSLYSAICWCVLVASV